MAKSGRRNRIVALTLVGVVGGMVGLSFASVPLYRLFCQVTGYAGTPKIGASATQPNALAGDVRTVTVEFDANIQRDVPWVFEPAQRRVTVRPGEPTLVFYRARNTSDKAVTGTATFNVTPYKAAQYFNKIACFCFTEQTLAAGQEVDMPVQFTVDPAILTDANTSTVHTLTLSYTFFLADPANPPAPKPTAAKPAAKNAAVGGAGHS